MNRIARQLSAQENLLPRSRRIFALWGLFFLVLTAVYLNHFDNAFQFDDWHAVQENPHIRQLSNIPRFFVDATLFSSLPTNQAYRPLTTATLAVDFWIGYQICGAPIVLKLPDWFRSYACHDGMDPFFFHLTTYCWFLLQLVVLFLFFRRFLRIERDEAAWGIAFLLTMWFGFHPVIAETVNYIIQRADLFSTLGVVAGFVIFDAYPRLRVFGLYLLPVILGCLAKQPGVMFAPLFTGYYWLFVRKSDFNIWRQRKHIVPTIVASIPSWVVCLAYFLLQHRLNPPTFTSGGTSVYHYAISQPWIMLYYLRCIFLPNELSADTDWATFSTILEWRCLLGWLGVVSLAFIAFKAARSERWRPLSFGILWWFLALLPTSSIIPLAEVMNDHRMFFPFVGAMLAIGNLAWVGIQTAWAQNHRSQLKLSCWIFIPVFLALNAYGTYSRNQVWNDDESLWEDVTVKSPLNGRGLMNYGLSQMNRGQTAKALYYFERALEITPYYHTLHVNLGVSYATLGRQAEAEKHFRKALELQPNLSQTHTFYARWLARWGRVDEGIEILEQSSRRFPQYLDVKLMLLDLYAYAQRWEDLKKTAEGILAEHPTHTGAQKALVYSVNALTEKSVSIPPPLRGVPSPEEESSNNVSFFLTKSLTHALQHEYLECIDAAAQALKLDSDSAEAFTNLGFCLAGLSRWEEAQSATRRALVLRPEFELAQNNLRWIEGELEKLKEKQRKP